MNRIKSEPIAISKESHRIQVFKYVLIMRQEEPPMFDDSTKFGFVSEELDTARPSKIYIHNFPSKV